MNERLEKERGWWLENRPAAAERELTIAETGEVARPAMSHNDENKRVEKAGKNKLEIRIEKKKAKINKAQEINFW
ncbi:MAG: hypothetical protein H5U05_00585 [Candidatus Aminicenantes bacterium]|nr:hypothetical protein [Candidatus Aminicenantes bacterium]